MKKILSICLAFVMLLSVTAGFGTQAFAETQLTTAKPSVVTLGDNGFCYFTPTQTGNYMFTFKTPYTEEYSSYHSFCLESPNGDYNNSYYYDSFSEYNSNDLSRTVEIVIYNNLKKGEQYKLVFESGCKKLAISTEYVKGSNAVDKVSLTITNKLSRYPYGTKFPGIGIKINGVYKNSNKYGSIGSLKATCSLRKGNNKRYYKSYDSVIKNSKNISTKSVLRDNFYYYVVSLKLNADDSKYFIPDMVCKNTEGFDYERIRNNYDESISYVCCKATKKTLNIIYRFYPEYGSYKGVVYQVKGKSATVVGRTSKKVKKIKVASKIYKKPVRNIGSYAFWGNDIVSVSFPNTVTKISYGSFAYCKKLKSVKLPAKLKTVENRSFEGCSRLKSFNISKKNKYHTTVKGVLYNKKKTKLEKYPEGKTNKKYTVLKGTRVIADSALCNAKFSNVTIPNSVTTISYASFSNCRKLKSVKLPSKLKTIDGTAFNDCAGLKSLSISKKNKYHTTVNGVLYNKKKTKLEIYPEGKTAKKYNIPNGTKEICDFAICHPKKLKKLYIPKSVKKIPYYGLRLDYEKPVITDIYYAGTKKQWNKLSRDTYIPDSVRIHYNAKKL